MAEEYDNNEQESEDEDLKDIWAMLNVDDSEEYDELQQDADEEIAKEDKMVKKLSAKMDNMQKKFESTMMKERINSFEKDASDLERGLFKTVAADVKDMSSLDKALGLVRERAAQMTAEAEKYKEQLEKQAQEQVAKAWGTSPVGTPHRSEDDDKARKEAIAKGDTKAGLAALMEDEPIFSNWG